MDPEMSNKLDALRSNIIEKYLAADQLMSKRENAAKLTSLQQELDETFQALNALLEKDREGSEEKGFPSIIEWQQQKDEFDARLKEWFLNVKARSSDQSDEMYSVRSSAADSDTGSIRSDATSRASIKRQIRRKLRLESAKLELQQKAEEFKEVDEIERQQAELERKQVAEQARVQKLKRQKELHDAMRKVALSDLELQAWENDSKAELVTERDWVTLDVTGFSSPGNERTPEATERSQTTDRRLDVFSPVNLLSMGTRDDICRKQEDQVLTYSNSTE